MLRQAFGVSFTSILHLTLFNIVLVSPQIPPNTGNIMRLCANTGCKLHLIEPLGFELDDAKLRRAGLDYREWVDVKVYPSYSDYVEEHDSSRSFMYSKFHSKLYTRVKYRPDDSLVFGSETKGLPESMRNAVFPYQRLVLPMLSGNRSLNLSNSVAVVVYEAWRQNEFSFDE